MFKRGGSSYEAQGTGITSPYDRPRKRYDVGTTQEDINERRRNLFQPRSEMDFAAEGYGHLGSPYNQRTGEAKTIGEMLHEGATSVRKSRAADKALGQSVDLANIQSDENRLLAEEKHVRDLELQTKGNPLLRDASIPRQVEKEQSSIIKVANANPQNKGSSFDLIYSGGIAQGRVTIRNLQTGDEVITAMVIPSELFETVEGVWDFDVGKLAAGMVYWDPTKMRWLIVENAQTGQAKEVYFDSYEAAKGGLKVKKSTEEKKSTSSDSDSSDKEIKTNEIKTKILTNLKGVELTDVVVNDEAQKVGIKIVEKPEGAGKNWKVALADNEMTLIDFKEILKTKKFSDSTEHLRSNKSNRGNIIEEITEQTEVAELAAGGRAGYALGNVVNQGEELDPATDELNELTSWWKSEVNKSFNS